jgi:hypothetical protein
MTKEAQGGDMNNAIISIIMLVLASCSSFRKDPSDNTSKELIPMIRIFEKDFRVKVTVPVEFDDLEPRLAGVCIFHDDGFRQVKINRKVWAELNEEQKEILVYHELVHCELRIDHVQPLHYESGCPISIMKPSIFTKHQAVTCFKQNRDFYLSEINMHRLFK